MYEANVVDRELGVKPFSCTDETLDELETALSRARLSTFLEAAGGDRESAIRLHAWNAAVGGAFCGPLQGLEVVLRNAMHRRLAECDGPAWYDHPGAGLDRGAVGRVAGAGSKLARDEWSSDDPRSACPGRVAGLFRAWCTSTTAVSNRLWRSRRKARMGAISATAFSSTPCSRTSGSRTSRRGVRCSTVPFNRGGNDGAGNPPNPSGIKTGHLWREVLTRECLTHILESDAQVVESRDERTGRNSRIQVWPRYHQLDVVRRLPADAAAHGAGRRYPIQLSAGNGKSNSIAWLAHQLIGLAKDGAPVFDSVIVVTDRLLLDRQIRDTIKRYAQAGATVGHADRSGDLRRFIEPGKKIIISTVQKIPFILDVLAHYTPVTSYYKPAKTVEDDPEFDVNKARKKLRRFVEGHDHAIRLKAEIMADHFHEQAARDDLDDEGRRQPALQVVHGQRRLQALDGGHRVRADDGTGRRGLSDGNPWNWNPRDRLVATSGNRLRRSPKGAADAAVTECRGRTSTLRLQDLGQLQAESGQHGVGGYGARLFQALDRRTGTVYEHLTCQGIDQPPELRAVLHVLAHLVLERGPAVRQGTQLDDEIRAKRQESRSLLGGQGGQAAMANPGGIRRSGRAVG